MCGHDPNPKGSAVSFSPWAKTLGGFCAQFSWISFYLYSNINNWHCLKVENPKVFNTHDKAHRLPKSKLFKKHPHAPSRTQLKREDPSSSDHPAKGIAYCSLEGIKCIQYVKTTWWPHLLLHLSDIWSYPTLNESALALSEPTAAPHRKACVEWIAWNCSRVPWEVK